MVSMDAERRWDCPKDASDRGTLGDTSGGRTLGLEAVARLGAQTVGQPSPQRLPLPWQPRQKDKAGEEQ